MGDVFWRELSRLLSVRRGFEDGTLLGVPALAGFLLVPTCCRFRGIHVTATVLIAFTILADVPIFTNVPRTATPYSLGAVGERLGQRDARKAHSGGLGEADPAVPRRAQQPLVTLMTLEWAMATVSWY